MRDQRVGWVWVGVRKREKVKDILQKTFVRTLEREREREREKRREEKRREERKIGSQTQSSK